MKNYIGEKIKLLKDFGIRLNNDQLAHIMSLKTEIAVDNFAHDLLKPSYDCDHVERRGKAGLFHDER